ncbi:MAG: hypothetical protein J3Q66DRAFT_1682 [Benniella sp.]|nr:MAG: hypothetical protein J3Q66DRAFT_1682 [Benniella sp.]
MPRADKLTTNTVAAAARQPSYKVAASQRAISAVGSSSSVVGPSPSVVVPTSSHSDEKAEAAGRRIAHSVGARFLKTVLGLHFYIKNPADGPGPLTTSRVKELAKIRDRDQVQRLVGAALIKSDLEAAFLEFVTHHAILGVTQWCMFVDRYRDSGADRNADLPHNEKGLAEVEPIIGHTFTNKKLIQMVLTVPGKSRPGPDYNSVEYLGDAVMEVLIVQSWVEKGSGADGATKTERSACILYIEDPIDGAGP